MRFVGWASSVEEGRVEKAILTADYRCTEFGTKNRTERKISFFPGANQNQVKRVDIGSGGLKKSMIEKLARLIASRRFTDHQGEVEKK